MQKNIKARAIVTLVIVAGWIWSIFPLGDQAYIEEVQNLAQSTISDNAVTDEQSAALLKTLTDATKLANEKSTKVNIDAANEAQKAYRTALTKKDIAAFEKALKEAEVVIEAKELDPVSKLPITKSIALATACRKNDVTLNRFISLYGQGNAKNKVIAKKIEKMTQGKLKAGIDISGGVEFIIAFKEKDIKVNSDGTTPTIDETVQKIIQILRNRIDSKGLAEAEIRAFGDSAVMVRVPAVSEESVAGIRSIITRPATLKFHRVYMANPNGPLSLTDQAKYKKIPSSNPDDAPINVEIVPAMSGDNIERATVGFDENGGNSVTKYFNKDGGDDFYEVTSKMVGKRLAIVLDGVNYSAPTIQDALRTNATITGDFTREEADELAIVLGSGSLPVDINISSESRTDATLGKDSVTNGIISALTGLLLVFVFMAWYYRGAGLIADIALVINIVLVFGTMTIWGATFTLPGIAGIILTIGMAVDANVLIFERIREELALGKHVDRAIKDGFDHSFSTIFDANITTLLTAFILAYFGEGAIKGFAYTLGIGIIASMFSALFVARIFFDNISNKKGGEKHLTGFAPRVPYVFNFWNSRKNAYVLSIALAVLAIGTMIGRGSNGLSVDFTGGTSLVYNMNDDSISKKDVESKLEAAGFKGFDVNTKEQVLAGSKQLDILIKETKADFAELANDKDAQGLFAKVDTALGASADVKNTEAALVRVGQNTVEAIVGAAFIKMAAKAVFFSLIGIFIYIMFRFEMIFAVGAITALVHDSVISIGLFMLIGSTMGLQISVPVIAALLTIIGYSLNDTIVVFDRIRENGDKIKKESMHDIMNKSINETFRRTLLTSITTFIVVAILCIFGGSGILEFALILLIGIIVGTYSSMFVAAPIVCGGDKLSNQLERDREEKLARERAKRNDQTVVAD